MAVVTIAAQAAGAAAVVVEEVWPQVERAPASQSQLVHSTIGKDKSQDNP